MTDPLQHPLDGRVAVLTGVSRPGQVGEAVARHLAGRGVSVVLIDRTGIDAEARASELRQSGLEARGYQADLTNTAQLAAVVQSVRDEFGGIDALVNIAGGFAMSGKLSDSDPEAWARQLSIGLTTAYLTTRAFLPLLRQRRGAVVFFASAAALPGGRIAEMSAYAVSKAGVITLMRAVAQEERDTGVRSNALAPTAIRTTANLSSMGDGVRYVEREEVAEAVEFLCFSPASRVISGQVVQLG
jgi:NAD(P)-dependent dehydrogenase (short-subunit alcohol dehydrogenase family)